MTTTRAGGGELDARLLAKLDVQLKAWQDELINLTKRNKLLYFKHTRSSSLEIISPGMTDIFRRLGPPGWSFHLPPDDEQDDRARQPAELLVDGKKSSEINRALRNLERVATQVQIDTGLMTLYLGFGMLRWTEPGDDREFESPLLLQPVKFERASLQADFRLEVAEDEPLINPALAIKLTTDFGISVPTLDEIEADPAVVVAAFRTAIAKKKGWHVEDRVVLTTFTFHKEVMFRDLVDNAAMVRANPLIQVIALGPEAPAVGDLGFERLPDEDLDRVAPPEDLVSIRDADSTQRMCIVAARSGRSFVMDGPPGTGKSQTITNIIAELIHSGKTVLFVSEKAAALDVVHNRLTAAGLGEFTLELHSQKATRKQVAAELGRALESRPKATSRFSVTQRAELIASRQELSNYATAMNEVRRPFGRSLHETLGRVVQLQHLPHAPVASAFGKDLDADAFAALMATASQWSRAWGPIERGDEFLWRSVRDVSLSASRQQQAATSLTRAKRTIDVLVATLEDVEAAAGVGPTTTLANAEQLCNLVRVVEENPLRSDAPVNWLLSDNHSEFTELLAQRVRDAAAYSAADDAAVALAGTAATRAPAAQAPHLRTALDALADEHPSVTVLDRWDRSWIDSARASLQRASEIAKRIVDDASTIDTAFGLPSASLPIARCVELSELAGFIGLPSAPEAAWLNPVVQAALAEAESTLATLVTDYRARREQLRETFTDGILELDLVGLRTRFKHNSGLHKLGSAYRVDKQALAVCTVAGKVTPNTIARLDSAIAWQELSQALSRAEQLHHGPLGRYYEGRMSTDFDRLHRALALARRALEITGGVAPDRLAAQVAQDSNPDPAVLQAGRRLKDSLDAWQSSVSELIVSDQDVRQLSNWVGRVLGHLTVVAAVMDETAALIGIPLGATTTMCLLDAVAEAKRIAGEVDEQMERDVALLGPRYRGLGSDFDAIEADLRWARKVVDANGAPLAETAAVELIQLPAQAALMADQLRDVHKAWSEIAEMFQLPYRDRLDADFLVSIADGRALIDELESTIGDIDEWDRHTRARNELVGANLENAIRFAETSDVRRDDVLGVIERSVLERWSDEIIAADPRLSTLAATERDKLVERFRALDAALVENASAQVINACSERRPTTVAGVAGFIQREAQKKTRHKPIRQLLGETKEVALRLKPCFMMSPLTVSQFLPSDLVFDVVIFDEASQVKPADAANCVYRGRQLIVAGDQKQLPPSNFFDAVSAGGSDEYDEEQPEVFESVLDVCRASGLVALPLLWHYRSQHESLITYSNYSFYKGQLLTFPGAKERADDVGVVFIPADGVYRRGGAKDNPIEAAKVVERVLFHRRNHPDLTLGVVAFSSAQESAIGAEIERQSADHPELDELLSADRLDGFFVKNLENVQGDERDIILFSIGYGPDENNRFTEQLGPLGFAGGERRLNVAITRARRRVEVISSVRSSQFPGTSMAAGIRHLQRYLDFAERGIEALALDVGAEGKDTESPFEDEVFRVVRNMGFEPVPQVGVAGFRIDLGVRHPARPGEFVLGIECDGAAYHSSRAARDRDRLRQEILEALGWQIHRIWGPSWYRDRAGQEAVLRKVIEVAMLGGGAAAVKRPPPSAGPTIEIDEAPLDEVPAWAVDYRVGRYLPNKPWIDFKDVGSRGDIAKAIEQFVDVEGPVHEDLLQKRVVNAFGIARTGSLVKEAYDRALADVTRARSIQRISKVFFTTATTDVRVRMPSVDADSNRIVGHVAPVERQEAIRRLVLDVHRIDREDLLVAFARLFGWKRAGVDIRSAFDGDVKALVNARSIQVGRDLQVTPGSESA